MLSPKQPCNICGQVLDAVLTGVGRHPNCGRSGSLNGDSLDRLLAYLGDALGVTVITKETEKAA